ncbi:MAG: hypothetical protein NC417_04795 [Candidatus Gastranaerophilales bacterium]|nr:hypothetical protein [Candidatus Gastranaerophilales bacterium]
MKEYVKPVVVVNDEVAEGVYTASGAGEDCYTVTTRIHQTPETGRGDYRIQVDAKHAAGDNHHSGKQTLVLYFNQPVTYSWSNGTLSEGDGTSTIKIDYTYHNNAYDNIGLGDVIVEADAGLSVTGAQLICNHDCGQH